MEASQKIYRLTVPWSSGQQRFVWSRTDTLTITTSTSQQIVMSAHYTVIAKASDYEEFLVTNLSKWPRSLSLCQCVPEVYNIIRKYDKENIGNGGKLHTRGVQEPECRSRLQPES